MPQNDPPKSETPHKPVKPAKQPDDAAPQGTSPAKGGRDSARAPGAASAVPTPAADEDTYD